MATSSSGSTKSESNKVLLDNKNNSTAWAYPTDENQNPIIPGSTH
jgi:hypothetical protein